MNEELQLALAKIIETTIGAKDFILAEAPDVIHQLLAWKLTVSLLVFLLAILITVLPVVLNLAAYRRLGKTYFSPFGDDSGIIHVLQFFLLLPVGLTWTSGAFDWLQILIAPKVYLLEYASRLLG